MKTTQKQLFNGRFVDNDSEAWREQCEAQTVLNYATRAQRWDHIRRVEERRGEAACMRLQAVMVNMMTTERQRNGIIQALMQYRDATYWRKFREVLTSDDFNNPTPATEKSLAL
jgi:hypothetical protein